MEAKLLNLILAATLIVSASIALVGYGETLGIKSCSLPVAMTP